MNIKHLYKYILTLSLIIISVSCDDNIYPRPKGEVRLEYPLPKYNIYTSETMNMHFEKSDFANVEVKNNEWINLKYPKLNATIHLTHKYINSNTQELIEEIQRLTDKHTVKASGIIPYPYSNPSTKTYGTLYEVTGNSASNIQFYITDSTNNMIYGALYFYTSPNPDSLAPAINYIKSDIITLMETLTWTN